MSELHSTTFVEIWNSSNTLDEVCQRTGKTRRKAVSLASSHRIKGKDLKVFDRPGARTALAGERFGRWTVIEVFRGSRRLCRCDCGTVREVDAGSMVSGASTGCYCTWKDRPIDEEAKSRMPEYKTWAGMKLRCTYPATNGYHNYGGRGITICQRWLDSFEDFLADMGQKPTPEHTIDRIDVNGNYEPGNCRWATWPEQASENRRVKPAKPCSNCSIPSKPLRKGRCHACNEYLRRNGKERPCELLMKTA